MFCALNKESSFWHWFFWLLGLLAAVLPYVVAKFAPAFTAPWIYPAGHFADNILHGAVHALLLTMVGGWIGQVVSGRQPWREFTAWWRRPAAFNWIWFVLTLLIYAMQNSFILSTFEMTRAEQLSATLGRFLTIFVVVSLLWIVSLAASSAAPRRVRYAPWLVAIVLPAYLVLDAASIVMWKTPARLAINRLDEQGSLNLARELATAGVGFGPTVFILLNVLGLLVAAGLFYLTVRLAAKGRMLSWLRPKPLSLFLLALLAWAGIFLEKGMGFGWKSPQALRWEHQRFAIHLSPFKPLAGVLPMEVKWKEAAVLDLAGHEAQREGVDIFFIMVESLRRDALTETTAPFLLEFAKDCQPLGQTWAGSNATHLSWFSVFNGQLPYLWKDASETYEKTGSLPASPWYQLLKEQNYRSTLRAVCDLSYSYMGITNYGEPPLLDTLQQVDKAEDAAFHDLSIPDREVEIFRRSREDLLAAPSSGNFHLIALDSPHYSYYWHRDFTPPYEDYDRQANFQAYPDEEAVRLIKNRYYNSVAWTDSLIRDFVTFLKEQGRYDRSLIIIAGDHGEEFQEHGSWFHCSSLEPEQTAVPIFIKWPEGTVAPAQSSSSHLDLLPSLLDYFGYPEEQWAQLPGRSLLREQKEKTEVVFTAYAGVSGVSMVWHRGDYTATFRWRQSWVLRAPEKIYLDDIVGPEGSLNCSSEKEWHAALKKRFPDAFGRLFEEVDPQTQRESGM